MGVDPDEKWCHHQKMAPRSDHLVNVLGGAIRPEEMFEYLVGDDEVELFGKR
jgi:hypothetical protein